jgi:mannose-1-phosphate guanylyltransferase
MKLIPVILCGDSGSELWPLARTLHPKPFIQLSNNESLLQKTFNLALNLNSITEIVTVTNRELLFKTHDEFMKTPPSSVELTYLLESTGKGTLPAISIANEYIYGKYGGDATIIVLPTHHIISDLVAFFDAVNIALELALEQSIVALGIKPTSSDTYFDYIEKKQDGLTQFHRKPTSETEKKEVCFENIVWNTGIICFNSHIMRQEMLTHCPDALQIIVDSFSTSNHINAPGYSYYEVDNTYFCELGECSINNALLEKTIHLEVLPCSFDWQDIDSWSSLANVMPTDDNGNHIHGEADIYNVQNCFVKSSDRVTGLVGVDNLVIIDTQDALLVAHKDSAQDVSHIFNALKQRGHGAVDIHTTVNRPWGSYTVLEEGKHHKIKQIEIKPKASISLQLHHHRSEHWIVLQGEAQVINGDEHIVLHQNESTFIPVENKHRLSNQTDDMLIIIEVQTGSYVGEDDIIRFEDAYGRV